MNWYVLRHADGTFMNRLGVKAPIQDAEVFTNVSDARISGACIAVRDLGEWFIVPVEATLVTADGDVLK